VGNSVFILGGQLIVHRLQDNQRVLHLVIGAVFAITAMLQAWKMWKQTDAISTME
jgi:hypothetical protein